MTVARPTFAGLRAGAVLAVLLALTGVWALAGAGGARHSVATSHHVTQLPPAARGPVAAALGADQPAYRIHGLRALNHPQRLRASFSAAGATIRSGAGAVSLSLTGFGRGDHLAAVRHAAPSSRANRVTYDRGPISEWYANGPLGLEQGFDIARAPAGGSAPLRLSLALGGNLRPSLHGGTLRLDGHGAELGYGGLYVSDARGRRLPASLSLHGRRLTISVEDSHAGYPLRIDPFVQQAELTPSDTVSGGYNPGMGSSVAISADGSTIATGAPFRSMNAPQNAPPQSDAVYVFTKPSSGWANATQTAMLTPSSDGLELGFSVAVSPDGSTIVAGAPGDSGTTTNSFTGAAYVFERPAGGWANATQTAKLTSSDNGGKLGTSVAISSDGRTVVAGAIQHSTGGIWDSQGALYVFTKPNSGWTDATQAAELEGSDSSSSSSLGSSVAISPSGDTIFGGADGQTVNSNPDEGAVYVFARPSSGWANGNEISELTAGDGSGGDEFGYAVAATDDALVVGAPYHTVGNDPQTTNQGAAYVVVKPGGGWTASPSATELSLSGGMPNGNFGKAVAISGQTVAVGAPNEPYGGNIYQGLVYVAGFTNDWSGLTFQQQVAANNGNDYAALGAGVGVAGDSLAAGASDTQVGNALHAGAVYEFGLVASAGGGGGTTTGNSGSRPGPVVGGAVNVSDSGPHAAGGLGGTKSADSVAKNGTVTLGHVTCSSPSSCAVHTMVTGTTGHTHSKLAAAARTKKKARKVTYGHAVVHVPAGKTRTVKIKLSHAGMRALRRAGKLKVTVTLVITSPGEKTVKKTFRVTLKAAKARKRHRN